VSEPVGLSQLRKATASAIANLKIFTRAQSKKIWRSAGFPATIWAGYDDLAAERLLAETGAWLLLTGTSDLDESADRVLWRAARRHSIQSHAVLDHPANLTMRFVERDGSTIWPDYLYVSDSIFAERLAETGAPRKRIRIIGDLHHARLLHLANSRKRHDIVALRKIWNAKPSGIVVLFVSDCAREMRLTGQPFPFDEVETLGSLSSRLSRGGELGGLSIDPRRLTVVIRPHPRDRVGKYDAIIDEYRSRIHFEVSTCGSPDVALLAADLVVGMESSLLYEAALLGRPVLSLTAHNLSMDKSYWNLDKKPPT
jgi:hypothetical protein